MKAQSLQFRLLSAASIVMLGALVLAGLGLVTLFERHLERRMEAELQIFLDQLIDRLEIGDDDRIRITSALADPRFDLPMSGLYWQIQEDERATLLRSRSLWDSRIELPQDELIPGEVHQHTLSGPSEHKIMTRERQIIVQDSGQARVLRIAVAQDRDALHAARHAFAADMLPYFALLAIFLILASWIQVRTGLAPLKKLCQGVLAIRSGKAERLTGQYPDEVMPLVHKIDELLDTRDAMIEKARAWTGDLAHGLKTPLSALSADAQRLRDAGQYEFADNLDQLAETMRQRVDRELIRARLRSADQSISKTADLVEISNRVLNTLQRTAANSELTWLSELPEKAVVNMGAEDLTELLGNLLDNAGKWAIRRVRLSLIQGDSMQLIIEDDGPGVAIEQRDLLGKRGIRLDQKTHGYGLGLAIVQDIVDAYGANLDFAKSSLGGLAVRISFACADD